ncbi:mucosa-associated lymphoid tissue lymphoma translocation protein 1 homolog [Cimex lectularius]|uniref:Mucosa-associated lymphoid tissue lymphoma translocation protein 1 n=1 Tax=Cimex lectularius TaxID=79782 RepID=A0A8I6TH48_CIMLE|nr:mucosa-associated lymphoid tissue lymphoma translocation protein 1 homolog [Cimex lectularius]
MSNILLEEFRLNEPRLYRRLVMELSLKERWKNVLKALSMSRKPLIFSKDKESKMELSQKPGEFLLNELIARQFTLSYFSEILLSCNELEILSCITTTPEPLKIIVQPGAHNSEINLFFGDELKLECRATKIPPPKYQWYHNNIPIDCTGPVFLIESFEPKHEGYYFCIASRYSDCSNFQSVQSDTVICKFIDRLPEFEYVRPGMEIYKEIGSRVTLSVGIKSNRECKLQWIKNNEVIKNGNSNELLINNLKDTDFGEYYCVASNIAGEVYSQKITLKLLSTKEKPPSSKVALLIANEKYENYKYLVTPCNDIILLAKILKQLNYHVVALMNLNLIEMQNIINWFFDMLPAGADAFFCFVGHGFQLSDNKFMMPIDSPSTIKMVDCICDQMLIMKAKTNKLRLLVLMMDMCLEIPKRDNPQIFNERPKQYIYKPYNACNVIRIFSTATHQNAYETQNQKHGIYIEHISKFLLEDKPIIDIFNEAHEAFEKTKFSKFQKPSLSIDGGHRLKLNVKPLENAEVDAKLNAICVLNNNHYRLSFPRGGENIFLHVAPHEGTILNAIDLNFYDFLFAFNVQLDTSPQICDPKYKCTSEELIFTLQNLQKVKKHDVFITIKIRKPNGEEDCCSLDLGIPLIAAADLWYQPVGEET